MEQPQDVPARPLDFSAHFPDHAPTMTKSEAYDAAADLLAALDARPIDAPAIAAHQARASRHRAPLDYLATLHRYDAPTITATFPAPATANHLQILRAAAQATGCRIVRRIASPHLAAARTPSGRLTITHPWTPAPPDPLAIDDAQAHALARDYRDALAETKRTGAPDPDAPAMLADLRALSRPLRYSVTWGPRHGTPRASTITAPAHATRSQIVTAAKRAAGITGQPLRAPFESILAIAAESTAGVLTIHPAPRTEV